MTTSVRLWRAAMAVGAPLSPERVARSTLVVALVLAFAAVVTLLRASGAATLPEALIRANPSATLAAAVSLALRNFVPSRATTIAARAGKKRGGGREEVRKKYPLIFPTTDICTPYKSHSHGSFSFMPVGQFHYH
jgi:hypothetical protein